MEKSWRSNMSDQEHERRVDEIRRRELAQRHRGEVVEESGVALEPRRLDHVVSLRLAPEVLSELRAIADVRNTTVSSVLREAAAHYATYADEVKELRLRVLSGAAQLSETHVWQDAPATQVRPRLTLV